MTRNGCQRRLCSCCYVPRALLAVLSATAAVAVAAAVAMDTGPTGRQQIPLTCQWSSWAPVSGRQCHWRNHTVGLEIRGSYENRLVTYCSQLVRIRRKQCDTAAAAAASSMSLQEEQQQQNFLDPSAFMPNSEQRNGEPMVVRHPADECTEERCGPLDGQWCYWIVSSGCDFHCRHAARNETEVYIQKQRHCQCPKPRNNGRQCAGPSSERELCQCGSLAASFTSFLRSTEGIIIAVGVAVVILVLAACCVSRVCCDDDDGAEDFKIGELPQQQQQHQHQQQHQQQHQHQPTASVGQPLVLTLDCAGHMAETDLSSLPGNATDSTTATGSDEAGSLVMRLFDCPGATPQLPPPRPPKRYKQRRQLQLSLDDSSLPLKYTPPFPNET